MIRKLLQVSAAAFMLIVVANQVMAEAGDVVVTTSSREVNMCVGETQNLKVFVVDTLGEITDFHFQWFYSPTAILTTDEGWVEVTGATEDTLQLANVVAENSLGNAGYYYCKALFGFGYLSFVKSERILVNVVAAAPTIGSVQAPSTVCEGAPLNFSAQGLQNASIRYWYHGSDFAANGNEYNVSAVSLSDAGEYTFVASNVCGEVSYGPFSLEVIELPRITTQPRPAGICEGEDLHFIVHATGDDLQYQWYYNNAPYPSTNGTDTNDTLTIEQAEHDSEFYSNFFYVQVSNTCATLTSNSVGTIVSEMPNVVGNPLPDNVCAGTEIVLTADATTAYPTDTIAYQWFLNGEPVENSNTNRLTFAMDSAHMGEWYCEFTNGCGSVQSASAQVLVKMPPVVETQPISISVCEGDMAQLQAKITGIEPMTYTWLKDNGDGQDFSDVSMQNVSGIHSSILVADPASEIHEHFYFCYATNECGSVRTDTVYLTVNQHIQVYPALASSFTACEGADTTISIANNVYEGSTLLEASDFESEGVTFEWHRQGSTEIVSAEPELHFSDLQDTDQGYYVCDVTNSCGTTTNGPIFVSVIASPRITVQPQDLDVCTGGSLTLSLSAEGDNIRYSWYRNGEYLGNNSPTYTAPTVASDYAGQYNCVIASELGCPTAYSDTVTVVVGTTPAISWQPTPAVMALCEGEAYDLTMTATGDGIHYQWYNNGNPLAGQTTSNLHIENVTRSNDGVFYCIVSNACDDVASNQAHLTVNNAPDMTLGPDLNPCRGESVVLGPQGDDVYGHYSWNFGTYGYQATLSTNLSGTYILEVSDSAHGNCVARDTIRVTFHDYFDIAFDETPIVTCGAFELNAGEGAAEYQWSTTDISSSILVGMTGVYTVTVDGDGYGCTTSASVSVTISDAITIDLGSDIVASEDTVLEIGVPAVFEAYRWNTGFTGPKLTVDGADYGVGNHTFWIEVTSGGCYATDTIMVTFLEDNFVEESEMPQLNIFPNPASDYVNIASENGVMSEIQVYDLTGRLVLVENPNAEYATMNINALVDATYFVRIIYADGKAGVSKLVIQK